MRVLGINAIFHDPSAALVVDGKIVAAAEEERFSRRKHGKRPVPFSAWELPELSMRWCLAQAGLRPEDLDAVAYSFDPALSKPPRSSDCPIPGTTCGRPTPRTRPGSSPRRCRGWTAQQVQFVPHHVAHAASARWRPRTDAARYWCWTGGGSGPRISPAGTSTAGWKFWPARNCRIRSAWSTSR